MNTELLLAGVVLLLFGVIIGGAGQAKLVRKAGKMVGLDDSPTPDAASIAENAATKAASAVIATATKTFRDELNSHVSGLTSHVQGLEKAIYKNGEVTTAIDKKLERLLGGCEAKHVSIDKRLDRLDKERSQCP